MKLVLGSALFLLTLASAGCVRESVPSSAAADPRTATLSVDRLQQQLGRGEAAPLVIDVREPHEFAAGHIEGARLAPLGQVPGALADVSKDRDIVLVCRSGNRSGKAQKLLAAQGYTRLANVEGGMLAWEGRGYPVVRE